MRKNLCKNLEKNDMYKNGRENETRKPSGAFSTLTTIFFIENATCQRQQELQKVCKIRSNAP